jgi:hypothetical protein
MTESSGVFTLPGIALKNQLTICKFKIKNAGGTEITSSITGLTVSDGTNTYTVSRAAAAGPIYVAMQPVSSDKTISFVVNDASNSYYKSVTGKTLAVNNQYTINVTMTTGTTTNLSSLGADHTAQNGETLTGTLAASRKISIAAGATVILKNVDINYGTPLTASSYAGITCLGNATLIISGTDYVKGFNVGYPGIFVPSGHTLTITGSGTLDVLSDEYGAAIGSGRYNIDAYNSCGNIVIQGGTIYARGGGSAASIGSGASIIFTQNDPGTPSSCGNITIKNSVTHVYVKQNSGAESIGKGQESTCGKITLEDPTKITEY